MKRSIKLKNSRIKLIRKKEIEEPRNILKDIINAQGRNVQNLMGKYYLSFYISIAQKAL